MLSGGGRCQILGYGFDKGDWLDPASRRGMRIDGSLTPGNPENRFPGSDNKTTPGSHAHTEGKGSLAVKSRPFDANCGWRYEVSEWC
jgi:hypothetical protein